MGQAVGNMFQRGCNVRIITSVLIVWIVDVVRIVIPRIDV